jgi:hypothetical protein
VEEGKVKVEEGKVKVEEGSIIEDAWRGERNIVLL